MLALNETESLTWPGTLTASCGLHHLLLRAWFAPPTLTAHQQCEDVLSESLWGSTGSAKVPSSLLLLGGSLKFTDRVLGVLISIETALYRKAKKRENLQDILLSYNMENPSGAVWPPGGRLLGRDLPRKSVSGCLSHSSMGGCVLFSCVLQAPRPCRPDPTVCDDICGNRGSEQIPNMEHPKSPCVLGWFGFTGFADANKCHPEVSSVWRACTVLALVGQTRILKASVFVQLLC